MNINNKRRKEIKTLKNFSQRNTTVAERQGLQRGGSLYKTDWDAWVSANASTYNPNYKLHIGRKALLNLIMVVR